MKREIRAALAATAAVLGAAFASGREIAFFFAQTGNVSWFGVALASVLYGAACGLICMQSGRTGATCMTGLLARSVNIGRVLGRIYLTAMLIVAGLMLAAIGKAALLLIPLRNAWGMGVAASMLLALCSCMNRRRVFPALGLLALVLCTVFHMALAVCPGGLPEQLVYRTVPRFEGSVSAAAVLAVLFAALAAMLSGDALAGCAASVRHPWLCALVCGSMLLCAVASGNGAIMRGGKRLLSLEMPAVVAASRWGKPGYYAALCMMWSSAQGTLCAAVGALAGRKTSASECAVSEKI